MKVIMIGAGYVGLVSGTCFAEFGANVTCIDVMQEKIDALNKGDIPIYEPGLNELIKNNITAGRLSFSTSMAELVPQADIIFIAVGTPTRRGDGHADLTFVYDAAKDISKYLDGYTVIVNKSTVPVGTARQVSRIISEINPEADFSVASNPEFLREGAAISDFMRPDRVILGIQDTRSEKMLRELYRPINLIEAPILVTNWESAELTKYASNAFLATKISFINEIANLCESVGADVHSVAKGMGLDGRIGKKFLHPGPGYGGSCFPKDTLALIRIAQENDVPSRIIESVVEVNAAQKARMVKKIKNSLGELSGKVIAVLGLTFKPETDDMRDSPSLSIIPPLLDKGAIIKAHDPQGIFEAKKELPKGVDYMDSALKAIIGADALVIMTEWNEYRSLDLCEIKKIMRGDIFIDLRNIYEREKVESLGLNYVAVGR